MVKRQLRQERFTLRLSEADKQLLQQASLHTGLSCSQLIRQAVQGVIAKQINGKKKVA